MQEIELTPPKTKISHKDVIFRLSQPIGLKTSSGVKFIVYFDKEIKFAIKRVDTLNTNGFTENYRNLHNLIESEIAEGEKLFLFDSWQEFYQWCAE